MSDALESTGALVEAIQRGDPAAQQTLFLRYVPRVRQMVAMRMGLHVARLPDDADDVVQDTLLNALQALPRFEHRSEGAFRAWIARIAENTLRNDARSRRTDKHRTVWQRCADLDLSATLFPTAGPGPTSAIEQREAATHIEDAILDLPTLYRSAIELRDVAGMSYGDLAESLGRTEANCRKIYQRAREMLQERLRPKA